jgi:hypothetical protein
MMQLHACLDHLNDTARRTRSTTLIYPMQLPNLRNKRQLKSFAINRSGYLGSTTEPALGEHTPSLFHSSRCHYPNLVVYYSLTPHYRLHFL